MPPVTYMRTAAPLTCAQALRELAAEALERRRLASRTQDDADRAAAGLVFDAFDELQEHRTQPGF